MIMLRGAGVVGAAGWAEVEGPESIVEGRRRCGVGRPGASALKQLEYQ